MLVFFICGYYTLSNLSEHYGCILGSNELNAFFGIKRANCDELIMVVLTLADWLNVGIRMKTKSS